MQLRQLREAAGLTQRELGNRISTDAILGRNTA